MRQEAISPTPEAMRHGDYVQGNGGRMATWTNRRPNLIAQLTGAGCITRMQMVGGLCFIETYNAVWHTGTRDTLDLGPRGGVAHETAERAERVARGRARLQTVMMRAGYDAYFMLISVCVYGEAIGRERGRRNCAAYAALRKGLDECVIAYGITDA